MTSSVDRVISPSAHQAVDLEAAGVTTPIDVIPNPIARAAREPRLLNAEQAGHPRILWVARCEPVKRPLVFAEAVIRALERAKFTVDFVGDGSELVRLRKLASGHPEIRVHGALGHADVIDLMDAASVVALSSFEFDNQPMTISEAVTRFRGVLYCDPVLQEGLHNGGFLAKTPDVDGLSDALVELVESPETLVALSEGARADSEIFAPAAYVKRVLATYAAAAAVKN